MLSRIADLSPRAFSQAARAGLGAGLALAVVSLAARLVATGRFSIEPMIVAPVAASAVLVFAVPASPLAQPRALIGGNLLGALGGVSCGLLIPQSLAAACAAVTVAIVAMTLLRCLHPPSGAVALGAALATGAGDGAIAYAQAAGPVLAASGLLALSAVAFVNLTGRTYPHRAAKPESPHATADPPPQARGGYTGADLDAALASYGELLDVSREDLDALFQSVEAQASRRIHSALRCADIMSRDVVAVQDDQSCDSALAFLRTHDLRTAPALDADGRVLGLVRRAELAAGGDRPVAAVVDPFVHKVRPNNAIASLLPLLSSGHTHEVMVVDEDRRLVGLITQTDLLAVLYRAHIVEAVAAA